MNDFTTELKTLLSKYNASIYFECDEGSDLHGVTGEAIVFSQRHGKAYKYSDLLRVPGYGVSASDIEDNETP